jgi:hypothetical protein
MFDYTAVNWLAVVIAAIAYVVIGTVWYLPTVFGNRWAALTGRDIAARPAPTVYVIGLIGALITAYVLALVGAVVVQAKGPVSLVDGIVIGIVVWAGFQATSQAVGGVFEGRSWTLWAINAGNGLVSFAVMGAILAVMS